MKRFRNNSQEEDTRAEINMSPLIDMVFLLLIFFMVTTVFVQETGVDVKKPQAATAETLAKNSILVAVTNDGRIVYGGQDIPLPRLRSQITQALGGRTLPVVVLADESSATGLVVQVIDQCKLAGASEVSIAAAREGIH